MSIFLHNCLYEFFAHGNLPGESLLDVGTGPNISSILSSSRCVKDIDLSDFAVQNVAVLKDWKSGRRELVQEITKHEMKICGDERPLSIRNEELRDKVKNIRRIDVNAPDLFIDSLPGPDQKYDIITSTLCLEAATSSSKEYLEAVRNVSKHLKVGGYFIIAGVLKQTFYRVGEYKFMCAYFTKEDITCIFTVCNYTILQWRSLNDEASVASRAKETDTTSLELCFSDFDDTFVMLAQYN